MKYSFEIYITTDNIQSDYWKKLYRALLSQLGLMNKFRIIFSCDKNIVRFFLESDKDVGVLSNNLEGIILQPLKVKYKIPKMTSKERFVQLVTGGDLLDLKEKYKVKKSKDLEITTFDIRPINSEKAYVKLGLIFKSAGDSYSIANKITTFVPYKLLSINFENNTKYLKKTIPKYLEIEKSLHLFTTNNNNALLEIDGFPYFSKQHYLSI